MKIDFGRLTEEETISIAKEALNNLSTDQIVAIVKDLLGPDDIDELVSQLTN